MVVVAEGLPFDEKSLSLACPNPYLRECLIQSKPRRVYRRNNVVVVAGLANICARILEPVDDNAAPKAVLFSQQASASQLYHAVSHLYEEYSSPDAFNLVLVYNDKKYPLKFENKPLPELNLKSIQGVQYADLGLNRASLNGDHPDKSLELNHKSPKDDNSSLNYKIIDVAPRDESSPLCWSFLISPSTTLRELDDNMLFLSARSPSQTQVHLNYQKTGLDTTAETQFVGPLENLNLTFRELNYDFPHPNHTMSIVLPIERIDESENKPRVNLEEHQFLQEIFPTTSDFIGPITEFKSAIKYKQEVEAKPEMTYVGLVNQAMTCYLNSLLQALYMTPEFRNALYNWEYSDGHDREKATHSIPFQLQKLFLNLQTSNKAAVETTSLTKSFGWDSTEAWQQHDIQELCRVMFEALEQKFKNTQQADLINRLYEGKMIDYVKCLECRTEKTREDTFLDIPLPVKPFGSNVAYNSVEEALRAFVQPETLDDVNQYFCENCNKKCDAHKGLKFTKFPYLLTLHLKRFDFDYNTFHRVKLNDKVTFPDVLNLNSFIPSDDQESPTAEEDAGVGVKCDDGSTTDSGNLDECPVTNGIHSEPSTELNNHEQDDDEGIDVSNGPSTSSTEQEHDNRRTGPYMYELFAIMIHSGSASGGHYYAYIKDLKTHEWLCFNDQNVTPITNDDIEKTYGGGPTRGYYSGAYSSSTNAYMLMYRQIDPQRNRPAMEVNDFPKHIKELLVKMKEEEEERRIERPSHMYKIKVYVHHPTEKVVKSRKIFSVYDETLTELLEKTYKTFDLDGIVDLNQCRLVTYDAQSDTIDSTFDGYENDTLETLLQSSDPDMLLEIRKKDEPFEKYLPGGIGTKVFILDCVKKEVVDGPIYVRAVRQQRIKDYKEAVAKATGLKSEHMAVVRSISRAKILADNEIIDSALIPSGNRVFVASTENLTDEKEIENNLLEVLANFDSFIALDVELPEVTQEILEELNIQSLESKQRQKEQKEQQQSEDNQKAKADGGETSSQKDENWYPICRSKETDESVEQSNSEDSSLSDSDRTLVGDASEDEELAPATTFDEWPGQDKRDRWENDPDYPEPDYYFKAIPYKKDDKRHLRVIVDRQMRFAVFRKHLEPFVGVPVESFKVIRHAADACDVDYTRLSTPLRTICYDGDNISIKLGRALRPNEFRVKVYYLNIKNTSDLPWTPLFEWTVSRDATVATVKKQLFDELKRKNIPSLAELTFEKCRLRKKNFQIPSKVLLNDQKIRDCGIQTQCEIILQELDEEDPVTSSDHVVVMVNRIRHNGGWVTGPINEIVLEDTYGASHKELADKLSQLSGIELEHLQISKGKWFGDYGVNAGMKQWLKASEGPWHCITLEDGASIFYRDSREKWVTENHDEMLLRQSDTKNKRRYGSDRRERALKIYLDNK